MESESILSDSEIRKIYKRTDTGLKWGSGVLFVSLCGFCGGFTPLYATLYQNNTSLDNMEILESLNCLTISNMMLILVSSFIIYKSMQTQDKYKHEIKRVIYDPQDKDSIAG